jgi:hypothetical protein
MGHVYLAWDRRLGRHVAIKFILGIEPSGWKKRRFETEARALAQLQHPNVLTIYEIGEIDGRPYLVMEFLSGETLDKIEKPMSWSRALGLGIDLSRGLAAAHRKGVLHRDIKGSNAISTHDGQVKLLDFGLAKLPARRSPPSLAPAHAGDSVPPPCAPTRRNVGMAPTPSLDAGESPPVDRRGSIVGTPGYMAPEVWRGEAATPRCDVYSLGALLFELCVGDPLYVDVDDDALQHVVETCDAPLLTDLVPGIDPAFAAIVARCLSRDPAARYASGEELHEALKALDPSARSGPVTTGNPYRGLRRFEAEHHALFFGRGTEIRTVLERLRDAPMVVVAGDSGVGKSSLCRAGVLPSLEAGALGGDWLWLTASFVPGRTPLHALAEALAPRLGMEQGALVRRLRSKPSALAEVAGERLGNNGLVLFVDQAEELITACDTEEGALVARALGHLTTGRPRVRLLLTARSDFLARLVALPGLGEEIPQALYLLEPLSKEGVREAITRPVHAAGVAVASAACVDSLVASAAKSKGALPLLQLVLAELWEARDPGGSPLTDATLGRIGGVDGALARHAEKVILSMTAVQRAVCCRSPFLVIPRSLHLG